MLIKSFCITRHFSFLVHFSLVGGEDSYLDFAISTPANFLPPEEDVPLLINLFTEMIKTDYGVSESIVEPVSNEEYLSACGLDCFEL